MAEGVNVRLSGPLRRFIDDRSGPGGLYESASEYIRDLIRRDFEQEEVRRWTWLVNELKPGITANEDEFVEFDPNHLIAEARSDQADHAS